MVLWGDRIPTHRTTGHSSYYMVHGVEPLLPFDITEATYLVPPQSAMSTTDLVALHARQLQKREEDLVAIHDRVMRARFASVRQFEKKYINTICEYQFSTRDLVLVRNSRVEMSLDRKSKPRWLGLMVVVRRTVGGSYILAEMDGAVSRLRFAAFRVIPYHARRKISIGTDFFSYPDDDNDDKPSSDEPSTLQIESPDRKS